MLSINSYLKNEFPKQEKLLKSLYFLNTFRKEFLSNILSFFKTSDITNTNFNINKFKKILISLKDNKITVTSADKNIVIILIDTKLYNNLCIEHLINDNTYKRIEFNPQFLIFDKAIKTLSNLFMHGHISKSIHNSISSNIYSKKLANFRILLKLHKENKFGIRPLINCSNTTLSVFSKTFDYYFKPFMINHFSYLKDSQNLIQKTKDKIYDNNLKLYSADFESLYTNIPLEKSIDIIMQLVSKMKLIDISSFAIYKFLKLVLLNNYFYFKRDNLYTFFIQIKGIAMGTACGPAVANLYLSYFELKYKSFLTNSLYFRFIDDIIYTDSNNSLTNKFPEIFPDLKLNTVTSNIVQFLDLNVSYNLDFSLNFDLFVKPTFTGSYLSINSNHPKYIYRGIVISLVSRIRRICTDINNYYLHCTKLLFYLLKKGYSSNLIWNIIRSFANKDRNNLIEYKTKNRNIFKNSLFFVTPFDTNFIIDHTFLNNCWSNCLPKESNLNNFNLKILYKNNPNLNSYFISKIKFPFKGTSYSPCNLNSCKICKYSISDNFLFNFEYTDIYLPYKTSCNSIHIIYAIHCLKCKKSYIQRTVYDNQRRVL